MRFDAEQMRRLMDEERTARLFDTLKGKASSDVERGDLDEIMQQAINLRRNAGRSWDPGSLAVGPQDRMPLDHEARFAAARLVGESA